MAEKNEYQACMAIPPGETLAEMLEDHNMPQNELAIRTGVSPKHVNGIIQGKAAISPDMALRLENVLGVSASFWNNLEVNYQETLARLELEKRMENEAAIMDKYNYTNMVKAGYVKATKSIKEKIQNLQRFFSVSSLEYVPSLMGAGAAFRKGDTETQKASPYALAAWIRQCEISAQSIITAEFNREKLLASLSEFRKATTRTPAEFVPFLQNVCAECGVAFVIVPHIPKTYANGVSKWLTPKKAMIGLSLRGAYADIFWFTLFHEIGHLVMGHSKKETFITWKTADTIDELEQEANRFAADRLIPPAEYKKFIATVSREKIITFSNHLGLHPGIVAGRLCNDCIYEWSQLNRFRIKYQYQAA